MESIKYAFLIGMMSSISSAVSNWGGEITKNPVVVFISIFAFSILYVLADVKGGE